jgi:hypothetical protein
MTFQRVKKLTLTPSDLGNPSDILRVINGLQSNIDDAITPMAFKSQNDSTILANVTLTQGINNIVNHTLGRQLAGWQIVRKRAQADIWDSQDSNTNPALTLLLNTSADVVVDILVF